MHPKTKQPKAGKWLFMLFVVGICVLAASTVFSPAIQIVPAVIAAEPTSTADVSENQSDEELISITITSILYNLDSIQNHYNEAVAAIGQTTAETGNVFGFSPTTNAKLARLIYEPFYDVNPGTFDAIPGGFRSALGSSGYIDAPAGACGGGASAKARFSSYGPYPGSYQQGGQLPQLYRISTVPEDEKILITGELLEEAEISNIDFELLVGTEEQSLDAILKELISPSDYRLLTPEGWNEAVWEPLADYQEPADSLMDYHLWSISPDIEQLVIDEIQAQMEAFGVPEIALTAFEESDSYGWFANSEPLPEHRLAFMEVEAEFAGDLQGIINEQREFSIPEIGEFPEFGEMIGGGEIIYTHPTLGPIEFEMQVHWTGWDEIGRVNVGTANFINEELGYEIEMRFNPDGTKEGDVIVDGINVGTVILSVEGTSTYIQLEE